MKKPIYLYCLTDARGDKVITVINEVSDNGCIGGVDKDGKYQQYDSYELWHAYGWAEKHGMKLQSATMEIDIDMGIFK